MRHFFGYDINGALRSIETYGPAGWPTDHCLINPACNKAAVLSLKEDRAAKNPEVIGWVLFDCGCNAGSGHLIRDCPCVAKKFANGYVDVATKTLKSKPQRSVYVDGALVNDRDTVSKPPGAVVRLKIVSADMENGQVAQCAQKGQIEIAAEPSWEMTFNGGETEEKVLVAPAQGTKGSVFIGGIRVRPLMFQLRGFAEVQ